MGHKLKRYMLFSGDEFYPSGGMKDFRGSFDSREDALKFFAEYKARSKYDDIDWYQIFNTKSGTVEDSRDY